MKCWTSFNSRWKRLRLTRLPLTSSRWHGKGFGSRTKVKIAGEVIPSHLKPGGVNPFGDLYELLSIGLHDLSDDECCDIVDAMDGSLRFICTRLKAHAAEAKSYEVAAKDINAKLAKLKARARE